MATIITLCGAGAYFYTLRIMARRRMWKQIEKVVDEVLAEYEAAERKENPQ